MSNLSVNTDPANDAGPVSRKVTKSSDISYQSVNRGEKMSLYSGREKDDI